MKLRENEGVILIVLNETFKKKRRKLHEITKQVRFCKTIVEIIQLIPGHMTIYCKSIFYFWKARSSRWQMFFFQMFFKTPELKSPFHKVLGLDTRNFLKNRLEHRCFLSNLRKKFYSTFYNRVLSVATFEWR